jgi:hypothetical protein
MKPPGWGNRHGTLNLGLQIFWLSHLNRKVPGHYTLYTNPVTQFIVRHLQIPLCKV